MIKQTSDRKHDGQDSACEEAIPAASIVGEADLGGVLVGVGSSGVEAFRMSTYPFRVGDMRALAVLNSERPIAKDDIKLALDQASEYASSLQHSAARFLGILREYLGLACGFVAIWQERKRCLTYSVVGFETLSIINPCWPHPSERMVTREIQTERGKIMCGSAELSRGERWLLYTLPLVGEKATQAKRFDAAKLSHSACSGIALSNLDWLDRLLNLALEAYHDSLPLGAVLISVVSEAGETR